MAITSTSNRDFDVQVLTDTIRGVFAQKTAFMGSPIAASGGVVINSQMTANRDFIGNTITVPYFGTLGSFVNNPDGSSVSTSSINTTNEQATVVRDSMAFEVSRWARFSGPDDADPYEEAARQVLIAAQRAMDARIITAAAASPLVQDVYSSSSPKLLNYDILSTATGAKWGDEYRDVVGMICHSQTVTDLRQLKDSTGRPLLIESQKFGEVPMFMGLPIVQSDRMPLTGSVMGTVASAGTSPPVLTITGTPTGAFDLRIKCILGGANATATIQFSTDGGNTWSATLTTLTAATPQALTDTVKDSLVGVNGTTGLSAAFASGTFNVDNTWASKANLKVSTMLIKRGALAFWYNANALEVETQPNVTADTTIAALHLYCAAHRYRRLADSTKPGVLVLRHNCNSFAG